MTRSTVQPLVYSVGIGEILTGHQIDMQTGEIVIFILKNRSNFVFAAGQNIDAETSKSLKLQIDPTPEVEFRFKDLDMAIKFYSGFFKKEPVDSIQSIKEKYGLYCQSTCA